MKEPLKSPSDFNNLIDLVVYFSDETKCLQYLEQWLHGGQVRCPYCGMDKIYRYKDGKRLKCASCREGFTLTVGTIFEHKRLPLVKWFAAIYMLGTNKKGLSASALAKHIGVTRKTSYFLLQKVRFILKQDDVELSGIVQSDETFVGGKNGNRHIDKKVKYAKNKYRISPDKTPVLGMLDDNGTVKAVVLKDAKFTSIKPVIMNSIVSGSTWVTDNYFSVRTLSKYFKREVVNHHQKKYFSDGGYTTNGIEGFWSHLKRMIIGVYHSVSPEHLQKYCNELTFRHNTRHLSEGDRFVLILSKANTRITHKQLKR